jgi:malonate-semialdehyde dehydrogenase (acetylating)/methylmalonate-semialdehyde dehydrogenase
MPDLIPHYIAGQRDPGAPDAPRGNVFNPATGEVAAEVAIAGRGEIERAVSAARTAQPAWAAVNPQRRARVMMRAAQLITDRIDSVARALSHEHGKMLDDARAEIQRGIEVCEFVAGAPHLLKGEFTAGAGRDIDMYSMRQPVGVGVGITPFNFPAMIPLWMAPPAIVCGNAFILKPPDRVPSVPLLLAELFAEAGLPAGIFSVINGRSATAEGLIDHPDVDAVSFVGSTPVARKVYARAASLGKRVQAFGGAKNHLVVLPDADIDAAVDGLVGAAYGSAGERCMSVSVAVPVGKEIADRLANALRHRVEALRVGPYTDETAEFGPLVSPEAKRRVLELVETGVAAGAELIVDGRDTRLQGHERGFFVGPCLFDRVTADMEIYRTEIFGPVLSIVRAGDFHEAVQLASGHEYGNGVSIYTRDGATARAFADRVAAGMVGINVPIPVPLAYYGFGGWKASAFGDLNQHGTDSIRFWTRTKTVTARWQSQAGTEFSMPQLR